MSEQYRWAVRCFRCGQPMDVRDVLRRSSVTSVNSYQRWWGFMPYHYKHYEVVDICYPCAAQEDAAERRSWLRLGGAYAAIGGSVLGYHYFGPLAFYGVWAAFVAFLVRTLRRQKNQLIVLPKEHV